jgi:hypothetical protein
MAMQAIDARPRIKRVIKFNRYRKRDDKALLIASAIRQLRPIEFFYRGGYRTAEPYALGIVLTEHVDNLSLLCFQTGGFSDLLEVVGWKLYRVSDMEELEVLKEHFSGDRPGYDPDKLEMVKVIECVKLAPRVEEPIVELPVEELKIETSPIPVQEPPPVVRYLTHNELMERFRYAHPMPIPELSAMLWTEPLVAPFPERVESKIWPSEPVLGSTHYLVGRTD